MADVVLEDDEFPEEPPTPTYVLQEEFDNAVRAIRNEISNFKVQIADLEQVVTAPEGSVKFLEVEGPPNGVQRSFGEVPWYDENSRI